MTRFMLAHLEGDPRLLDQHSFALMHTPALGADELGTLADGERMTLGFFQEDRNGHRILGHGGGTIAFHSHLQIYPDDGAGIYVTLSSSGAPATVTATIRQQLVDGFADRYFPRRGAESPTLETSARHAQQAEGSYVTSRRMESTFLRSLTLMQSTVSAGPDGTLEVSTLRAADGTPKRWREIEPRVFQEVGGQDRVALRAEGERVTAIGFDSAFALTPAAAPAPTALLILASRAPTVTPWRSSTRSRPWSPRGSTRWW